MGATRATLRERIRDRYAERDTEWTGEGELNQWIQEAHDDLADTYYYASIQVADLVANQEEYDISELRLVQLQGVYILRDGGTTYYRLKPIPWWRFQQLRDGIWTTSTPTSTGTPAYYCIHGDSLYFESCPSYAESDGIKVWFAGSETLDEDTDETHLPRRFESLVTWYSLAEWYGKDRQQEKEAFYRQKYRQGKDALGAWVDSNKSDWPEMIAPSEVRGVQYG